MFEWIQTSISHVNVTGIVDDWFCSVDFITVNAVLLFKIRHQSPIIGCLLFYDSHDPYLYLQFSLARQPLDCILLESEIDFAKSSLFRCITGDLDMQLLVTISCVPTLTKHSTKTLIHYFTVKRKQVRKKRKEKKYNNNNNNKEHQGQGEACLFVCCNQFVVTRILVLLKSF